MAISTTTLIARIRQLTYDNSAVAQRYTDVQYLDMINEGQIAVARLVPSISNKIVAHSCIDGFQQAIPSADGFLYIRALQVIGGPALLPTTIAALDAADPNWRTVVNGTVTVPRQVAEDPNNPYVFYLYPGKAPSIALSVSLQYAFIPVAISTVGNAITINDIFQSSLVYYAAYKAFEADSENAANKALSDTYFQKFTSLTLGATPGVSQT